MSEKQFSQLLKGNQKRYSKTCADLVRPLGVSICTVKKYINNPLAMSVNDLLIVVKELNVSREDLIDFLGVR